MNPPAKRKRAAVPQRPAPPIPSAGPDLGECLRQLRFQRRLSMSQVSVSTGISKSTLSRVERNQLSLTYDKLLQLCSGLRIDLASLLSFDRTSGRAPQLTRRTFTPPGAGRRISVNLLGYEYLCTELAGKKMTPMIGFIGARTFAETNGLMKHEGEEFTFVIEGRLELHTEFYEPLVLEVGGSTYFDSTMGHAYVSTGSTPLKVICVCSTPDPVLATLDVPAAPAAAVRPKAATRRTRSRPG